MVKARLQNHSLVFINIYAPTNGTERKSFLEKVGTVLNGCGDDFLFLGGDFNCTESFLDRNHAEPHPASQHCLRQLAYSHGLVDVWRRMHADNRQYTWSRMSEGRISSARLDRFYCFKHHFSVFSSCRIMPVGFTDHSLVLGEVAVKNILPKSAYWHFNSSLAQDNSFRDVLRHFWLGFRERKSDFTCLRQWWDRGKVEMQLLCQQYTLNATQDTRRSIKDLEMEIVELEAIGSSTRDRGCIETLQSKKMALASLLDSQVQGALVRSRIQDLTEMDAPSSFFFGLEKKRGQNLIIHSLLSSTGQEPVEPGQIRQRAVEFFSSLYESEYRRDDGLFHEFCGDLPRVSEEANSQLDRPLQLDELHAALLSMKGRKSPGVDGLTVEFFKAYWDIVAHDMLEVFNESLASGSLPLSCRRAVVTLLPKKGNLQEIKNWRPVSLLCVDYRILSKTLASRLREAMEQVIHRDQTYCVPDRSIVDNVHLIRDVLEVSRSLDVDTGLISLDQEKAFDRVEHQFLWKVMERFGFSPGFIAMIRVLYCDIESMLKFNGSLCAPFRVRRGVRQGCALSGMLYALSLEPLLSRVRANVDGLFLPSFYRKIVLSAYADDLIVMVRSQRDVDVLSNLTVLFNRLSAARVNWQKSEALAVGRWTNGLPVLPQDLAWRRDGLKYLGVFIGDEETEKKNWLDTLEKVDGKIQKWKWLLPRMSYRGRTLVLNNLVASVLWHRLSCMEPPSGLLAQLQTRVLAFFWDGMHWVQQGVLYLPREEGGQGLIHLASRTAAFRIQFVQRFLTGPADLMWRDVARCVFRRVSNLGLDDALFLTDFKFAKLNGLPPFYQSVVKAWALFKVEKRTSSESLYWLLREPTVHGARLDVSAEAPPRLTAALWRTRTLLLQHVVAVAGPDLTGAEAVGSLLGIRSTQAAEGVLRLWRNRLSTRERRILEDYGQGTEPDSEDPFPEIRLVAHLGNLDGPLLRPAKTFSLQAVEKKTLYNDCVRVLNRRGLSNRSTSVWADRLGGDGARPCWRVLYKPPLKKRTGDLSGGSYMGLSP
uniref:Reverse transcriptase domain-containing protein n=1 Tax=Takifugu rubripes TaxID=31033 RepID=A0A674MKT3_TAKRU